MPRVGLAPPASGPPVVHPYYCLSSLGRLFHGSLFPVASLVGHRQLPHMHSPPAPLPAPCSATRQGATLTFNLLDPNGEYLSWLSAAQRLSAAGLHVRSGCMCNPGTYCAALGEGWTRGGKEAVVGWGCAAACLVPRRSMAPMRPGLEQQRWCSSAAVGPAAQTRPSHAVGNVCLPTPGSVLCCPAKSNLRSDRTSPARPPGAGVSEQEVMQLAQQKGPSGAPFPWEWIVLPRPATGSGARLRRLPLGALRASLGFMSRWVPRVGVAVWVGGWVGVEE